MNYEDVKDKLEIHLCDTKKNSNRLQGMIHTEHGDFSATYHIRISDMTQDGVASTPVTPQHMETWGITTDQLHQDALKSDLQKGAQLADISDMMESMMTGEEPKNILMSGERERREGILSLTNREYLNGASLLLQDDLMQQIADIVGGNFYVLPSSVHETLIVPDNGMLELRELSAMVYEVNRAEVEPQDRLSDNVQYYDTETRTLENAQNREGRIELEKPEKMSAKESRKGIHERLGEKKAQEKTAPKAEKAMEKAAKKSHDLAV